MKIGRAALLILLLTLGGCRGPAEVVPELDLRAASADSTHIEISFPEALDPVAMSDTSNYRVEMPGLPSQPPRFLPVRRADVVDTLRGRTLRLETGAAPDQVSLRVWIRSIRLLTGPSEPGHDLPVRLVTGLSYGKDVAPLFAVSCNSCHSGADPAGQYATDSYFALFGSGTASPGNLLPGDPGCLLVLKCLPGASMFHKGELEYFDASMLRNWVVFYQAR